MILASWIGLRNFMRRDFVTLISDFENPKVLQQGCHIKVGFPGLSPRLHIAQTIVDTYLQQNKIRISHIITNRKTCLTQIDFAPLDT